jgi:hypothetical protein
MTGQNDRGFLAGAQFGSGAFQAGRQIAATEERTRQERELQPFRVEAAKASNEIARQQLDIRAALFPLELKGQQLRNEQAAATILSTNLDIDMKEIAASDEVQFKAAQANWMLDVPTEPFLQTKESIAKWELWKGTTELGRAKVNEETARMDFQKKQIDLAAEALKAGIDTYTYDAKGNRSALPDAMKLEKAFQTITEQKRESALETRDVDGVRFFKSGPNSWSVMPNQAGEAPDSTTINGRTYIRTGPNSWTEQKPEKTDRSITVKDDATGVTLRLTPTEYEVWKIDKEIESLKGEKTGVFGFRSPKDNSQRIQELQRRRSELMGEGTKAAPMPKSKGELKKGTTYETPKGPLRWNGTVFEKAE